MQKSIRRQSRPDGHRHDRGDFQPAVQDRCVDRSAGKLRAVRYSDEPTNVRLHQEAQALQQERTIERRQFQPEDRFSRRGKSPRRSGRGRRSGWHHY